MFFLNRCYNAMTGYPKLTLNVNLKSQAYVLLATINKLELAEVGKEKGGADLQFNLEKLANLSSGLFLFFHISTFETRI